MEADNEYISLQIDELKQRIISKFLSGSIKREAIDTIYPERSISDKLDFQGNATITGRDAALQIMRLSEQFS